MHNQRTIGIKCSKHYILDTTRDNQQLAVCNDAIGAIYYMLYLDQAIIAWRSSCLDLKVAQKNVPGIKLARKEVSKLKATCHLM